jgi:putative glutamine amidotransferase
VRPLIAITTTIWPGGYLQLPRVQLDAAYLSAVEAAGGTPLLLTPGHGPAATADLLERVDGLLLSGGEDVEPARYGQTAIPEVEETNPARDDAELRAVSVALRRRIPILGVCRGMQLLNVACGGTLIQDIPSQRGGDILHQQPVPVGERWHGARVEPGSQLAEALGLEELRINSFHHQAVDVLGQGLRATAWAEDGIVEGLEGTAHPWLLGVQWHPERNEAHAAHGEVTDPDRMLVRAFVRAAAEHGAARAEPATARAAD